MFQGDFGFNHELSHNIITRTRTRIGSKVRCLCFHYPSDSSRQSPAKPTGSNEHTHRDRSSQAANAEPTGFDTSFQGNTALE